MNISILSSHGQTRDSNSGSSSCRSPGQRKKQLTSNQIHAFTSVLFNYIGSLTFLGCLPETEVFSDIPEDPVIELKDQFIEESSIPLFPVIKCQNGENEM
jgi:hypothetical protein